MSQKITKILGETRRQFRVGTLAIFLVVLGTVAFNPGHSYAQCGVSGCTNNPLPPETVPEPGSIVLLVSGIGAGIAGLKLARRKRP
jgi:hypothetical protein